MTEFKSVIRNQETTNFAIAKAFEWCLGFVYVWKSLSDLIRCMTNNTAHYLAIHKTVNKYLVKCHKNCMYHQRIFKIMRLLRPDYCPIEMNRIRNLTVFRISTPILVNGLNLFCCFVKLYLITVLMSIWITVRCSYATLYLVEKKKTIAKRRKF